MIKVCLVDLIVVIWKYLESGLVLLWQSIMVRYFGEIFLNRSQWVRQPRPKWNQLVVKVGGEVARTKAAN